MSVLQMSLSIPTPTQSLASSSNISIPPIPARSFLATKFSHLSLTSTTQNPIIPFKTIPIRMGGGPRTFPGGVSKWQWKRMQQKKAKQLLKARLARERQIYEMRKRAELKAAVSELERPWEVVEKAPNLFSVPADEQLKVLADRFQRPGGFDMWSDKDGPELFRPDNGLLSARFFPKGVVHSVKPYGRTEKSIDEIKKLDGSDSRSSQGSVLGEIQRKMSVQSKGNRGNSGRLRSGFDNGGSVDDFVTKNVKEASNEVDDRNMFTGPSEKKEIRREYFSDKKGSNLSDVGFRSRVDKESPVVRVHEYRRGNGYGRRKNRNSKMYDMSLQNDGQYGIELEN